eukprot:6755568-Pyramimonas_sp.AAC.1
MYPLWPALHFDACVGRDLAAAAGSSPLPPPAPQQTGGRRELEPRGSGWVVSSVVGVKMGGGLV